MGAAVSCRALDGGFVGRDCAANASRTRSAIRAASPNSAARIGRSPAPVTPVIWPPEEPLILERLTPAVDESDLAKRAAWRAPQHPQRVAQRGQRRRLDLSRGAGQPPDLPVPEPVGGRDSAPH